MLHFSTNYRITAKEYGANAMRIVHVFTLADPIGQTIRIEVNDDATKKSIYAYGFLDREQMLRVFERDNNHTQSGDALTKAILNGRTEAILDIIAAHLYARLCKNGTFRNMPAHPCCKYFEHQYACHTKQAQKTMDALRNS